MRVKARSIFKNKHIARWLLAASGLIAVAIAATILFEPEAFYASYGLDVRGQTSLVNELKAPAGMLLVAGLIMFAGVFRTDYIPLSLLTAAAVYLSYGFARVGSMALDGMPHQGLVNAAGLELLIGAACVLCLPLVRRVN